ncbi:FAD-dependent oxidoreductase [Frigidibacter albus]|uniref:FAD-dependent oxidoreductase n=1 Tax=Frigidibacter albus TaxID=1465486 RepID=A0A6L8VHM5_9RHOB|nr:FAD-binding oxidoreductase [Frigidibacter albus]MZQ89938.1 FAD-dependent oxidoreductase [Frigidibacter albus]NBE31687.1 FAD-dependent oxidoreductase [Frigidibacter albus]GGH55889.1 gamma-glutamylputrescine oxidase [Frigidibacter albus]
MNLLFANDRAGEYPASFYAATAAPLERFAPLQGATRADVCIVGGGYTGLSAALHLAQRGLSVVLLEAHRIGFGASGRNGGQVGSGQRLEQDELEQIAGREAARRLWDLGEEAKALVQGLIADHAMPCKFAPGIVHACRKPSEVAHARAYAEKLQREYGYDKVQPLDREALHAILPSDAYCGGDIDRGAGHLHPLNFAIGLAQAAAAAGAVLHEGSTVTAIEQGPRPRVITQGGHVEADHVILAANGYLGGLMPQVAARVMPINNFIVATQPLGPRVADVLRENVAVADTRFVVNYWRLSEDNRLLFGGGESYGYRFPDIARTVRGPMLEVYPQLSDAKIDYAWGGTLAITMSRLPCFLRVAPNILSASGYSGHGVALATLAGKVMAEAVAGQAERFDLLAGLPTPRFPGGVALRWPMLVLAMTWYGMRDRLGV